MKKQITKGTVLTIVTALLMVVTALVYAMSKSKEHSPLIIGLLLAAAVLALLSIKLKGLPLIEYAPFVCVLASMSVFIRLAFDEIGDILSKINMDGLSSSWIASAVLLGLSVLSCALCSIFPEKQ